jgi:hypothetical protein
MSCSFRRRLCRSVAPLASVLEIQWAPSRAVPWSSRSNHHSVDKGRSSANKCETTRWGTSMDCRVVHRTMPGRYLLDRMQRDRKPGPRLDPSLEDIRQKLRTIPAGVAPVRRPRFTPRRSVRPEASLSQERRRGRLHHRDARCPSQRARSPEAPTHSSTECAPGPPVRSRTCSTAASPRGHDDCSAELFDERDAVGMVTNEVYPFGRAASGGNDAAQTDRAIANDSRRFPGPTLAETGA